jgi:hypothetical protein
MEMEHSHRADQIAAPFDQFEHVFGIRAVDIRMAPILDRGPIASFSNGKNFESQLSEAREAATREHRDFMTSAKNEPAKLGINLRNQRARMSSIRSIERRNTSRIATLPRRLPSLNATTSSHRSKLTRRLRGDNGAAPSHWVQGSPPASLVEVV